jgi:hypothetical protein
MPKAGSKIAGRSARELMISAAGCLNLGQCPSVGH